MMSRRFLTCAWALLIGTACGCPASGPELANVEGSVTIDGKPIYGANIVFRPLAEKGGGVSYGVTNKEGHYKLEKTAKLSGALPGEYQVDVTTDKPTKAELADLKASGLPEPPEFVPIPKKYRKKDAWKVTVERGKPNVIDFAMTTE